MLALAACTSPEAARVRAGGPGGDTGNRGQIVHLHEGADPYWTTPQRLAGEVRAPLTTRQEGRPAGETAPAASPR
jgi:hypothetical protein